MQIQPPLEAFEAKNATRGPARPTHSVNAWVADSADTEPEISLTWDTPVHLSNIIFEFDPDWDHPMESVLMTHPEEMVPFMIRDFDLMDDSGSVIASVRDHRGARYELNLESSLETSSLKLRIHRTYGAPAAVFRVRCYS